MSLYSTVVPENVPATPSPDSPARRPSRLRRWTFRTLRVLVLVYLGLCLLLWLFQGVLMFPGAYVHSKEAGRVAPAPDRELLDLHTPDGKHVAALFGEALNPDGSPVNDPSTCPTILYLYGNGDCIATSLRQFHDFRRLGANVLIPEYIGYPLSGGHPSEKNLYATADSAYAYLMSRNDIDHNQIVVVGRSIGGGPAIDLASREPVAGLATFSAFTSMDEMARKMMPLFPTGLFLNQHFNNLQKIASVKCPMFLAHGTRDDFVPFAMMARLAARAKQPVTTYQIVGATHNDIFPVGGEDLLENFGQFLRSVHAAHRASMR